MQQHHRGVLGRVVKSSVVQETVGMALQSAALTIMQLAVMMQHHAISINNYGQSM